MIASIGEQQPFMSTYGPIAFGNILYAGMVDWTGGDEPDLLTIRCHTGLFLFRASWHRIAESPLQETQLCGTFDTLMHSLAFNERAYSDVLIYADRKGFMHRLR